MMSPSGTETRDNMASTPAADVAPGDASVLQEKSSGHDDTFPGSSPADTTTTMDHDGEKPRRPSLSNTGSDRSGESTAAEEGGPPPADPFLVEWEGDGSNDPMCPRSISHGRKWAIVLIVSAASFCVTGASSIYTSAYAAMEAEFGNSRIVSTLGLSLFVLGLALGPMLFGPLSEFYGRRPIYLVAWTMYLIWIIPQAVAPNIATMIVCRFLDGFAGSTFLAVSGGTVSDLFSREQLQWPMAIFSAAPFTGPCIGPLIGGFINQNTPVWRWTFWVLLIWAGVLEVAIVFFVPETFHPVLLRKKANKVRAETGDNRWHAATETVRDGSGKDTPPHAPTDFGAVSRAIGLSLLRPIQLLVLEPMCLCLCTFTAILLGILYLFFGAFPLVFGTVYGFTLDQVGLSFLGILTGLIIGCAMDPVWAGVRARLSRKLSAETGVEGASEPEFRLPAAMLGSLCVPVGIFIFAWTCYPSVHWIVPMVGAMLFGFGIVLVFTSVFTFLVDAYPAYAASAMAANTFSRCLFATAFPLFGTQMYKALGIHWATSLVAFLTVAMIPFPFLFFKYGKQLRQRSRFARA
ncbi:major facilitator superfamily domain-containing protein [Microdochium trichocladiopsis]|uniref:Major facilitator superfamily domain-containing protein n=1 Tax=Microdochium trichocladiopsis TaxID=1682393 RepID=A0A9P8Y2F8_9PEZI|nr:major facilitator superfamily domain-containing protein [Microdochium trichocladiopsis]KAH7027960.1 major facilitator superfamily domain-containing protein [Microdochium trichocladiopsis]